MTPSLCNCARWDIVDVNVLTDASGRMKEGGERRAAANMRGWKNGDGSGSGSADRSGEICQ